MTQDIDLKEIERKAFTSYHQDGLADIMAGLGILLAGISMIYDVSTIVIICICLFAPLGAKAKKALTIPRIGFVQFNKALFSRKNRVLILAFTVTFIAGIVNFITFTGDEVGWKALVKDLELVPFGFAASLILAVVGFLFSIDRLIVYALLTVSSFIICHLFDLSPAINFFFLGAVILVTGIVLLLRFLAKYPLRKLEGINHAD